MEAIYSLQLNIPATQVGLLLALSTLMLLFGRAKMALLVHYLFALYWGYVLNKEAFIGSGSPHSEMFVFGYFGFGFLVVVLALIGFMYRSS